MFQILICEDEANIRKLMRVYLRGENYSVHECENGAQALEIVGSTHIDLLVTDVMMPEMDGYELVQHLRDAGYTFPVLMVTAKETIDDKKRGYELGIDDYMVKPADMDEMLMRVSALLRRAKSANEKCIILGSTEIDYDQFLVRVSEENIHLPKKEFQLLFLLISNLNHLYTRMQILDEIWGYDADSDERTVDVHIKRLREKFEHSQDFEIVTVRGVGYKAVKK